MRQEEKPLTNTRVDGWIEKGYDSQKGSLNLATESAGTLSGASQLLEVSDAGKGEVL